MKKIAEKLKIFCNGVRLHFAMTERNWLGTRQEKARKTHNNLPKARQVFEVAHLMCQKKIKSAADKRNKNRPEY